MADRDPIVGPLEVQLGDDGRRLIGIDGKRRLLIYHDGKKWCCTIDRLDQPSRHYAPIIHFTRAGDIEIFCDMLAIARAELLKPEMANG
jgi:hypothetical protein